MNFKQLNLNGWSLKKKLTLYFAMILLISISLASIFTYKSVENKLNKTLMIGGSDSLNDMKNIIESTSDSNTKKALQTILIDMEEKDTLLSTSIDSLTYNIVLQLILTTIVIFTIIIIFSKVIIENALKPLIHCSAHLEEMATGDYSNIIEVSEYNKKDEINTMANALMNMKLNTIQLIHELKNISNEICDNSNGLLKGIEECKTITSHTTNGMEDLGIKVDSQVAFSNTIKIKAMILQDDIEETMEHLDESINVSDITKQSGYEGIQIMNKLNSQTLEGITNIKNLVGKVKDVHEYSLNARGITELINNIAKQTNLLALNASIEASRAGEYGKGFYVVADEIKKLSQNTTDATKDIQILISNIQESAEKAVSSIEYISTILDTQESLVKSTTDVFEKTVNCIDELIMNLGHVKSHAENMSESETDITSTIENIITISNDNANSYKDILSCTKGQLDIINELYDEVCINNKISEKIFNAIGLFKV